MSIYNKFQEVKAKVLSQNKFEKSDLIKEQIFMTSTLEVCEGPWNLLHVCGFKTIDLLFIFASDGLVEGQKIGHILWTS